MPLFAEINPTDNSFIREKLFDARPANPAAKSKPWVWVPLTVTRQAVDQDTEIENPTPVEVIDVPGDFMTRTFTKRNKTAQELDDDRQAVVDSTQNDRRWRMLIAALADGGAPGGETPAEFLDRMKNA